VHDEREISESPLSQASGSSGSSQLSQSSAKSEPEDVKINLNNDDPNIITLFPVEGEEDKHYDSEHIEQSEIQESIEEEGEQEQIIEGIPEQEEEEDELESQSHKRAKISDNDAVFES
jgi:hypothetical protein